MKTKTIKKSIDINAPRGKVWDVLHLDEYTRTWYAEFSPGSHAETDWKVGSKAVFTDHSGEGIIGKVIENKPGEILSLEYYGVVVKGKEDYESEEAKNLLGSRETYVLSEKNGVTHLDIECDMREDMFVMMSASWEKALKKLQELAETN